MKTSELSAFSGEQSDPSVSAFFSVEDDVAPQGAQSSYDFFGNSELLITKTDR